MATADAFVHALRPQAIEGLGLGYEAIRKIKPDIVYVGAYGYSADGPYGKLPAYDDAMKTAYGEEKSARILGLARHNTVYYPSLTIKGAIQSIRVVRPIAVDKTLVESWTFRLKGAPPELLARTTMYNRLINSPFSVVGHDDLQAYRGIQAGLHASGNDWVSLHRNFDPAEVGQAEVTAVGTSEISMRNHSRAWLQHRTSTM